MKKGMLLFALLAMLLSTVAFAQEKGNVSPNPDLQTVSTNVHDTGVRSYYVDESFEIAVPPAGWTSMTSGETYPWVQADAAANTGTYCAAVPYGPNGTWQDEWLVAPAINTVGLTGLQIRWAELDLSGYWSGYGNEHAVMVSTTVPDDPGAFSTVQAFTPATHDIDGTVWQGVQVDLGAYIGHETLYVALRYQGGFADNWLVDDVLIFQPLAHDVRATGVDPSGTSVFAGGSIPPQVSVVNMGGNTESFAVLLTASLDGVPFYTETASVVDLAPSAETVVAFPAFTSELGEYVLTATTQLVGDEYAANDTAAGAFSCVDQVRRPFGILYTNWGCGFCPAASQALDDWYPLQGDAASLIRVHVRYPYVNDPMYQDNTAESNFLLDDIPPVSVTGTPTLYMDNLVDTWDGVYENLTWSDRVEQAYVDRSAIPAPLTMELLYDPDAEQLRVDLDIVQALSPTETWLLYVAVTEDNVEYVSPNDEVIHNQVFRKLYPGSGGTVIASEAGPYTYWVDVVPDPAWVEENLRVTAWIMNMSDGEVANSATIFLTGGVVSTGDETQPDQPGDTPAFQTRLVGNYPNPFNPLTGISFSVGRTQNVRLSVFNMSGQRVAVLADGVFETGTHTVSWNGQDFSGRDVASGTYLVHMESEESIRASKMMLVR